MPGRERCRFPPAPDAPQGPGDRPWCGLAPPDSTTCFPCQPRAAGTRGSGPRPTAAAAAAPSNLMASAEQARRSRDPGPVQQPALLLETVKVTPAISAEEHFRGEGYEGGAKTREGEASGSQVRAASSAARLPSTDWEEKVQSLCVANQAFKARCKKDAAFISFAYTAKWRNVYI